ncbi:t-SNARE [Saitoella complicata NRRL Y-17804]|nr:t-SNARE [Saitoella complicata NRRL Y-17804]ODQ53701.1 t-SNARE [Saitoella complicata NRRL Y-17804]
MATRNRTNLFLSYRSTYGYPTSNHASAPAVRFNGFRRTSEERQGLMSENDNGDTVIEMDMIPPKWADVSDEVHELLDQIKKKSATLDKLHQKHVLPGFDDRREEEGRIEDLTSEITMHFHDCQRLIKKIEAQSRGTDSEAEAIMAKNIQISLATKVQESSSAFRKKQSTYLRRLKGHSITRPDTPTQFTQDEDLDVSMSQTAIQQSATLTSNDTAIMQREREITDIAKGIIELADIFKELQTMVIDQGTMLDRIDYNVERLHVHVKAADKELTQATNYEKRIRRRKLIMLMILIIAGLIIVLIYKPKRHTRVVYTPAPPAGPEAVPASDWDVGA